VQSRAIHPQARKAHAVTRGSRCAFAVLAAIAWTAAWCRAAEPPPTPAPPSLREVGPELFYVERDDGRLVPVPGFQYRDFIDLLRVKDGLAGPLEPPPAILEQLAVRIDARRPDPAVANASPPAAATGSATLEYTIVQSAPGWALVPLEAGGLLLSAPPRHDGPGRMLVDAAPGGGYRAWFDAAPEAGAAARHVVVLEGRLPIESGSDQDQFVLRLPTAVASRVEVATGRERPTVRTVPPAPEQTVTAADDGGSVVSLAGLAGTSRIVIASGAAAEPTAAATPSATRPSPSRGSPPPPAAACGCRCRRRPCSARSGRRPCCSPAVALPRRPPSTSPCHSTARAGPWCRCRASGRSTRPVRRRSIRSASRSKGSLRGGSGVA
jgi:hypothetical protein